MLLVGTLRPEEWSVHYSLRAASGVGREKNLDVQTKVCTHTCRRPLFGAQEWVYKRGLTAHQGGLFCSCFQVLVWNSEESENSILFELSLPD